MGQQKTAPITLIFVALAAASIAGGIFYFVGANQGRKSNTNASSTSEESTARSGIEGEDAGEEKPGGPDTSENAADPAPVTATSESTTTSVTSTTIAAAETLETIAIVKSASQKDGKRFVTLDYVEMLTGEKGAQYLIAKGDCTGSVQDCMPENDFVIKNENTKLRTLEVSAGATIAMEDPAKEGPAGKMGQANMSWSEFHGYHQKGAQNAHVDTLHKAKVVNGVVQDLLEMYTP